MRRDMKRYRLPEPVVVPADGPGPAEHAELADSLSMPFLVLLEALSPAERAVFTLREVFGDLALERGVGWLGQMRRDAGRGQLLAESAWSAVPALPLARF